MILAIESTAHTFGIAVVDEKKQREKCILANVSHTYITEKGGIVPNEAAKHHELWRERLLQEALEKAGMELKELKDIGYVAFSQGPGLSPCLIKGKELAKELCLKLKVPLIPVNHCIAHLEVAREVTEAKDPVLLYVSGANTQVIAYAAKRYRVFGETLDIGVGNLFDSFARHIGIGFPGGPKIEEMAKKYEKQGKELVELPYSVKGMDVAFSGLSTNVKQKYDSGKYSIEQLCYSFQEHVFAMLLEVAERAMAHLAKKELALGGGVACNSRLQEMAIKMARARKARCFIPPKPLLVDNAAMIGITAKFMLKARQYGFDKKEIEEIRIKPYQRTDDVEVFWRED